MYHSPIQLDVFLTDVQMRRVKRKGLRGTNAALLDIEAPTLELESIPCAP